MSILSSGLESSLLKRTSLSPSTSSKATMTFSAKSIPRSKSSPTISISIPSEEEFPIIFAELINFKLIFAG